MKLKSIKLVSLITLIIACSPPTQLTHTWTDPSVTTSGFKPFSKVLVVARLKDQTGDRIAEDKISAQFKQSKALPSYSYLMPNDTVPNVVDAKLQKDGFDGLVTMRLKEVEKSMSVYNDPYGYGYGGFYGAHYYGYGGVSSVSIDKSYLVETCIYSLSSGKLLWSCTTSSFNPNSLEEMMDQIITAVKNQLVKQGLMQP
jgi:hypothetical protein